MTVPISRIWITDTAAMVGSIFHSRYWRMTIGRVVRPGPTCVCLAYVRGKLRFEGAIASLVGSLVGM